MKRHEILAVSGILLLMVSLALAGCTSAPYGTPAATPAPGAAGTPPAATCGFTSCHGLDLACGSSPPQVCTADYQLGDRCRQYAYCDGSSGSCTLVKTPRFETCRACVEKCGGADATEILTCEEKC